MPDWRFAVMGVLASAKVFRRVGPATLAEAETSVEVLRALMTGARPVRCIGSRPGGAGRRAVSR